MGENWPPNQRLEKKLVTYSKTGKKLATHSKTPTQRLEKNWSPGNIFLRGGVEQTF
jgi:hypothetical protein